MHFNPFIYPNYITSYSSKAENRSITTMTEENEAEPLELIIESDQAVEPDAKVAEELRMLPENKEEY
jgi:hypothetical protein